uniref:Uncharacterized protein n=1 Tax=Varanus komodoensis TaxID=61221 RepID=A0A8D2ITN1_VARKO
MSLHGKHKEIYKPWTVYAMNWSVRPNKRFRLRLGSYSSEFICRNTFDHPYPTTKLMWISDTKGVYPDLLATSGDYLRVWRVGETEMRSSSRRRQQQQHLLPAVKVTRIPPGGLRGTASHSKPNYLSCYVTYSEYGLV